jgi:predicted Rossmann fold nucleotide-binding protein DprA/Smf involved in DNA uptake
VIVIGHLAALAGFDLMTVSRLRVLLAHHHPIEAYAVAAGQAQPAPPIDRLLTPEVRSAWRASAERRLPSEWAERCRAAGVRVVTMRDTEFPAPLRHDPQPPAVLFVRGDLAALDARRVGIVGTRNATGTGRETAAMLGRELADAGVSVVSGLAKGIDGAAHRGALRGQSSTRRTRGSTRRCGTRSPPVVCCSRSGRRGRRPSRSASPCAIGSSPRSARSSWSSRVASAVAR